MAFQSSGRQFYVGVGGQQAGPYSEDQVIDQIRQGQIPSDALVWYEGLGDWQPISGIEYFRGAFESAASGAPPAPGYASNTASSAPKSYSSSSSRTGSGSSTNRRPGSGSSSKKRPTSKKGKRADESTLDSTFARNKNDLAPIFSDTGGGISGRSVQQLKIAGAVVGTMVAISLCYSAFSEFFSESETLETPAASSPNRRFPPKPGAPGASGAPAATDEASRRERLRQALSQLSTVPKVALPSLRSLVTEKPDDAIAKDALQLYSDELKKSGNTLEVGKLLLEIKRPQEALTYFLQQQPQPPYELVADASFMAYELATDPAKKRDFLIQNIRVLLNPLKRDKLAIERVIKLGKDFPSQPNPFRYYLQSSDLKLVDLFERMSFYFVKSLLGFIEAEFPEVRLSARPKVELKRDKQGAMRIVGSYKGDVVLSNDRLKGIFITFWLVEESWQVVDTNLTPERRKYANEVRLKLADKSMTRDGALSYLEQLFQAQFPSTPLYDRVKIESESKAAKD